MKFVNRIRLRAKMVEKGYTVVSLAKELDISRAALYNKLSGRVDFTEFEIVVLKSIFGNYIFL